MKFTDDSDDNATIPLAPMIDIMFLLLSFFAVAQIHAQYESEVDITLPTAETSQLPERLQGEIVVNVKKDGSYFVNGQSLTIEQLAAKLAAVVGYFKDQSVIIRGDKDARHQDVVRVLDQCRKVDIWNISIATLEPEKAP